jgi:hypothetical protein
MTTCEPGFGRPVTIDRALDAIRAHGFSVPAGTDCTGSLAAFGNTDAGPGVREREGQLHCFLQESSPDGASTSVRRKDADGADVRLRSTTSSARFSPTARRAGRRSAGSRQHSLIWSAQSGHRIALRRTRW